MKIHNKLKFKTIISRANKIAGYERFIDFGDTIHGYTFDQKSKNDESIFVVNENLCYRFLINKNRLNKDYFCDYINNLY